MQGCGAPLSTDTQVKTSHLSDLKHHPEVLLTGKPCYPLYGFYVMATPSRIAYGGAASSSRQNSPKTIRTAQIATLPRQQVR